MSIRASIPGLLEVIDLISDDEVSFYSSQSTVSMEVGQEEDEEGFAGHSMAVRPFSGEQSEVFDSVNGELEVKGVEGQEEKKSD
jgi:hypothetical protein